MDAGNQVFPARAVLSHPRVFGYTLGCRLNSCETDAIVESVVARFRGTRADGFQEADIIIVNTCTVTGRSSARCRKAVKGFRSGNPLAFIVVTGCASEIDPEGFSGIPGCLVTGNNGKGSIPELLLGTEPAEPDGSVFPAFAHSGKRTRAFLKIQDGCDNRCAYCIVPMARGASRSQPRETVLARAMDFKTMGKKEICLVGVDLADYGHGDPSGVDLACLVRELLALGGFRIRLSSLEPPLLGESMLGRLALPGVCRHFHIPLQSGSTRILAAMGRRYTRAGEEALLSSIHRLFPGACIGADLITGLPGETEEDHQETLSLARSGMLAYLHVFPYSPRPGTAAALLPRVQPRVVTRRAGELRAVSEMIRKRFRESMIGSGGLILVEGRKHGGALVGLTDNYVPVAAPAGAVEGELVPVALNRDNICWGLRS